MLDEFSWAPRNVMCVKLWSMEFAVFLARCIVDIDKGKPTERWGRKATGLRSIVYDSGVACKDRIAVSGRVLFFK